MIIKEWHIKVDGWRVAASSRTMSMVPGKGNHRANRLKQFGGRAAHSEGSEAHGGAENVWARCGHVSGHPHVWRRYAHTFTLLLGRNGRSHHLSHTGRPQLPPPLYQLLLLAHSNCHLGVRGGTPGPDVPCVGRSGVGDHFLTCWCLGVIIMNPIPSTYTAYPTDPGRIARYGTSRGVRLRNTSLSHPRLFSACPPWGRCTFWVYYIWPPSGRTGQWADGLTDRFVGHEPIMSLSPTLENGSVTLILLSHLVSSTLGLGV